DAVGLGGALVGTKLVVCSKDACVRVARIVETEAYRGPKDLACHARAGITKRTKTLYGPHGHAYVYLIYGMYDCFNVVCFGEGKGHAVLVRAGEPVIGLDHSARTDGPGRLTRALGITRSHDTAALVDRAVMHIAPRIKRPRIEVTARVGVAYAGEIADAPWRFFDAQSTHSSRPPKRQIGRGILNPES